MTARRTYFDATYLVDRDMETGLVVTDDEPYRPGVLTEREWAENMGRACPCIVRTVTFRAMSGESWTREIVEHRSPYCAEHNPEAFWPEKGNP